MIKEFSGKNRFLSNFFRVGVWHDGYLYPTTENAYQASKTTDIKTRFRFISLTPREAKDLGQTIIKRADWVDVKVHIMYQLNLQKFSINPLRNMLLETGEQEIIEGNTWDDTFWGVCNGVGSNHLGKVLMKVRKELRGQSQ
jgi:ribA/ribD-fused uncharacterized protein